jgi:ACS family hexuronate transporter-like MFS transporter
MFPRSAVGSATGIGTMAGAVSAFLFAKYIGHILQLSHSDYSILFIIAASVYLLSLLINVLLAPGLKKVELSA